MNTKHDMEPSTSENREADLQTASTHKKMDRQHTQAAIQPLPAEVIAQIKSLTTITTLTAVILDLLKNALDAEADNIEVTVNFRRGGCVVEDNGLGILPAEYSQDGGLGKMYYTSKHNSVSPVYGRTGTFLASLSALSLLTITSHHRLHRSTNSVTFHSSSVISRSTPAPPQHELSSREHGTRVTVRDLFGNIPVRVKQRALLLEERLELDRLWDTLRRRVVGLVLAWHKPVVIRVRDEETGTGLTLQGQKVSASLALIEKSGNETQKRQSANLQRVLSTLTQAALIAPENWKLWVPISATALSLSISGAISLEPAPSKGIQFISVGVEPLFVDAGRNELYDEVNRLFSLSNFGAVEESEVDEAEKERRRNDKRYKADGFTKKQKKGGAKGIDRWPMFCLKITIKNSKGAGSIGAGPLDNDLTLQSVTEVLTAMITRWLSVHHFRPRKRRARKPNSRPASATTTDSAATDTDSSARQDSFQEDRIIKAGRGISQVDASGSKGLTLNRKRKRSGAEPCQRAGNDTPPHGGVLSFSGWSRIKSGNPALYDNIWNAKKPSSAPPLRDEGLKQQQIADTTPTGHTLGAGTAAVFNTPPVLPGQLGASTRSMTVKSSTNGTSEAGDIVDQTDQGFVRTSDTAVPQDGLMEWTDSATKETFLVNSRTGAVVPHPQETRSAPTVTTADVATLKDFQRPLRVASRIKPSAGEYSNTWINGFLAAWDNPVFRNTERGIPQVSSDYLSTTPATLQQAFKDSSSSRGGIRLSKTGLSKAMIIAQVDKKFILARMDDSEGDGPVQTIQNRQRKQLLVLIDQHAADERCRVEELLADLCAPPPTSSSPYRSKTGQISGVKYELLPKPLIFKLPTQECQMFEAHAPHFAAWGILYDLTSTESGDISTGKSSSQQQTLIVRTLPPTIAERCKTDPKLLISLLRSEIWKLNETPSRRRTNRLLSTCQVASSALVPSLAAQIASNPSAADTAQEREARPWLRRIGSCPQGILDLLNSRACRSAVMFNDELRLEECERLVRRLAECAFPFQCAHGRPSMVPLVEMGRVWDGGEEEGEGTGFVEAFRAWRRREDGNEGGDAGR